MEAPRRLLRPPSARPLERRAGLERADRGDGARAQRALEAETLSKLALLSGADGARRALAEHGGLVVHDDGDVELIGPLDLRGNLAACPFRSAA